MKNHGKLDIGMEIVHHDKLKIVNDHKTSSFVDFRYLSVYELCIFFLVTNIYIAVLAKILLITLGCHFH